MSARPSQILAGAFERFEDGTDLTLGIEEEYQILDPATGALVNRFEELVAAAPSSLADRLAGELIASEIEYRTPRCETFADAARALTEGRLAVAGLAERLGAAIGISGVHPFSTWPDQRIIDTEHYRRVESGLGYVAWTNNTWSLHLHCGVRGADRAIKVCGALRSVLPELLALSANSAVFWGRPTRLHSTRTQVFTRSFPRCGVPDAFEDWRDYADFVTMLEHTGSIVESTQIWWSVRPHHSFGTIEVRICDGQTEMSQALGLAALIVAVIARFLADADDGRPLPSHPGRLIEENLWRAQRHGLPGALIDLDRGVEIPTVEAIERLIEWSAPATGGLGLDPYIRLVRSTLSGENGAMRQLRRLEELAGDVQALHLETVERTRASATEILSTIGAVTA